jgi:CO dehydrogenase/acetyl-CoA synthase alpha subunit
MVYNEFSFLGGNSANQWEVKMRKARDILDSENKMLEQLIVVINSFAKDVKDDFERQNLECWGKELRGYTEVNKKYIGMKDDELRAALTKEVDLLTACEKSITQENDAASYWKQNMEENRWYTEQTRERV